MKIFVLNCGSSSVKFQFINNENEEKLAWGIAEKIGSEKALFTYKNNKGFVLSKKETSFPDHTVAVKMIIDCLQKSESGVIKNISEIDGIGHRVVHGGEDFASSVKITDEVVNKMKELIFLAPLHNPANIKGIEVCRELFPKHMQCGVFDTSYHQKMPKHAFLYAIPKEYYDKHKIKRYGFHGTSHRFVSSQIAKELGKAKKDLKIITCHLGNGSSICAIKDGKSVDTSMGLTPLEGLVMGTRAGDMDPAIPMFFMENFKMSISDVNNILNKKSGVLGISGKCNDMRELHEWIAKGDEDSKLALAMYCYRIRKYIGAYMAAMGGVDVIVFTGGVGENDEFVREITLRDMDFFGIKLDEKLNLDLNRKRGKISKEDSKVGVYIIPTNEELLISQDTEKLIKGEKIEY
jgi:acetate kinase